MKKIIFSFIILIQVATLQAQDLHFSQYYNAPQLLNPALAGLHNNADWRAGVNYRSQWLSIPVPYNTFSGFADFGLLKNKFENSWLGMGIAAYKDVAGNGDLALTKFQGNIAYHVYLNDNSTLSLGMGAASAQRSVDLSKLTFETQWDEFTFNSAAPNQEGNITTKTSFIDLNAGINFSYYDKNDFYLKFSLAVAHLNRPRETFYGESNRLGIRPLAQLECIYKASSTIILNPTIYYTQQKKASELLFGNIMNINVNGNSSNLITNEFMLGTHLRWKDAFIGSVGYKYKNYQLMVSYDQNISDLKRATNGNGAIEMSFIVTGPYHSDDVTKSISCPRF